MPNNSQHFEDEFNEIYDFEISRPAKASMFMLGVAIVMTLVVVISGWSSDRRKLNKYQQLAKKANSRAQQLDREIELRDQMFDQYRRSGWMNIRLFSAIDEWRQCLIPESGEYVVRYKSKDPASIGTFNYRDNSVSINHGQEKTVWFDKQTYVSFLSSEASDVWVFDIFPNRKIKSTHQFSNR